MEKAQVLQHSSEAGGGFLSQWLPDPPRCKLLSFQTTLRDTALSWDTYHYTTHKAHCSSRSTASCCRRLAESQGHAKLAIASLPEPSLRFSPDLTSTASHIPRKAKHLGQLEQKKTAASLIPMTTVAAFNGNTQRGHKQTLPGLGASLTFPLPGSWSPTIAIHAVPSTAFQLHTLTSTQRVPSKTSSILPVSVKAKEPFAASVPECKTCSNCAYLSTSISQHRGGNHKMCPCQTAKGMRQVQGSFWVSQGDSSLPTVLQSYENVLARNYKAARLRTWGQSLTVSVRPLWQAASILLIPPHANQGG